MQAVVVVSAFLASAAAFAAWVRPLTLALVGTVGGALLAVLLGLGSVLDSDALRVAAAVVFIALAVVSWALLWAPSRRSR
jgi:hypothetical protein